MVGETKGCGKVQKSVELCGICTMPLKPITLQIRSLVFSTVDPTLANRLAPFCQRV
jgi:hypothetical protein